jgi:Tol biopolymer transport system component
MTTEARFERQLPAILEDLYLGPSPDYRDEVLAAATRPRQRPAWTFAGRWLPMADIATQAPIAPRIPWRTIGVALVIIALLAAAAVAYVGSHQTRVPPPFGIAKNGLIAYAADGDLFTADPVTGVTTAILTDAAIDRNPVFSHDGTRVAFLRHVGDMSSDTFDVVVADADGHNSKVLTTSQVHDDDQVVWGPNGSFLVVTTSDARVTRYDVTGSAAPVVIAEHAHVQAGAFRPPDGVQILYQPDGASHALYVMNADGTGARPLLEIPAAEAMGSDFGSVHWSPDGTMVAFQRAPVGDQRQSRIFVMNANGTDVRQLSTEAGTWFETDLVWSPDGKQVAFDRWRYNPSTDGWDIQPIGIVPIGGGSVVSAGPTPVSDGAAFDWSPDGKSLVSIPGTILGWPNPAMTGAKPMLIDVAAGSSRELGWTVGSATSWQRLAP